MRSIRRPDINSLFVFKQSIGSSLVKIISMLANLGLSVLVANILSAEDFGILNLSHRIVNILIVISLFGMQQVVMKRVSVAHANTDLDTIDSVVKSGVLLSGLISLSITVILVLLSDVIANNVFGMSELKAPFIIGVVVLVPKIISRIISFALFGMHKTWQGSLEEQSLNIVITMILVFALFLVQPSAINLVSVAILYTLGRFIATVGFIVYWRRCHKTGFVSYKKSLKFRELLEEGASFWVLSISIVLVLNVDSIILGLFEDSRSVALYNIATRLAILMSFLLSVTNSALSPKIAKLYSLNELKEMEKMVQFVSLVLTTISFVCLLFFVYFGESVLSIWGQEYIEAYWVLIILSIGQFVNTAVGPAGAVLNMCGFHKQQRKIALIFGGFNIVSNVLLIRYYGVLGAAVATSLTVIGQNIARFVVVRRKLGMSTITIFRKW